jgi:hypothetical protein
MACYDQWYSGQVIEQGPSYASGNFECIDCDAPLTTDDDPYYKPPKRPYLGPLTTISFLLMEFIGLVAGVYVWVMFGPLWGFLVGMGIGMIGLKWLHRKIKAYLDYEPPDLVRIEIPELERRPDRLITDDLLTDDRGPSQDITGYS